MTNKELIESVIDLYVEARKSKFPSDKIIRARSHTTSSVVEDLMAYFFSNLIDADIIIDKSFSVQFENKRKTIYPDIAIKRGNIITSFFDIKMDLGWKRHEFPDYCIGKSRMIKEIRGQVVNFGKKQVLLNEKLKYEIIIVSQLNITEKMLSRNMKIIKEANIDKEVPIYFLTNKVHPNYRDSEYTKSNIEINHEQLDKLREQIKAG